MSDEGVGTEEQKDPFSEMRAADILPEEFKGRDPAEVRLLLSQMPKIVRSQKEELENLRTQLAGGGAPTVTHGAPAEPPEPKLSPEEEAAKFAEKFDKDPVQALREFVHGELSGNLGRLDERVGETEFTLVKQSIPDFHEFEDDVRGILSRTRSPATQENIRNAYTYLVGQRTLQRKEQELRAQASSPPAAATPDNAEKKVELTALQQEVANSMGLSAEEYAEYTSPDSFKLNIRT
jgi:hypothetical protein